MIFPFALVIALSVIIPAGTLAAAEDEEIRVTLAGGKVTLETSEMILSLDTDTMRAETKYPRSDDKFAVTIARVLCFDSGEDGLFVEGTEIYEADLSSSDWSISAPVRQELADGTTTVAVSMNLMLDAKIPSWLPDVWVPPVASPPQTTSDWAVVTVTISISTSETTFMLPDGTAYVVEKLHEAKVDLTIEQLVPLGLGAIAVAHTIDVPPNGDGFVVELEEMGGVVPVVPKPVVPENMVPDYTQFLNTDAGKQVAYVANPDGLREAFFAWSSWAETTGDGAEIPVDAHYRTTETGIELLLVAEGEADQLVTVMYDSSLGIVQETFEYLRRVFLANLQSLAIGALAAMAATLVVLALRIRKSEKEVKGLSLEHNRFLRKP